MWRIPAAVALVELGLVVAGAHFYWRAARATGNIEHANLAGRVVLGSGVLVLALDYWE